MGKRRTVVYCSDGNDIRYLSASMFSLRKFIPDVDIVILSDTIAPSEVDGAKVIDPSDVLNDVGFSSCGWNRRWPYATLYRMAIPLMEEFRDYDKVLYLDTDTLAVSGDMGRIFDIDTQSHEVVAAKDINGTSNRIIKRVYDELSASASEEILKRIWKGRKLAEQTYVNAGVTIWCPGKIVENGLDWYRSRLRWFWEAECRGGFEYLDQDFINSMMDVGALIPAEFNCFTGVSYSKMSLRHFIRNSKQEMLEAAAELGYGSAVGKEKVIVYSSDGRDADRLAMSAFSARRFLGPDIKFYILTELDKYPGMPYATLINPTKALAEVGITGDGWNRKWPFCTLNRLAIPLLEELKDADRILYLDTDVLIRSYDAGRLFSIDSRGYEVYGALDVDYQQYNIDRITTRELCREAKDLLGEKWAENATKVRSYINAGVLLMFLSETRKRGIDEYKRKLKWFWEAECRGMFKYLDQDFINVMMDVNSGLSPRYNKIGGDLGTECVIHHLVGDNKRHMPEIVNSFGYGRVKLPPVQTVANGARSDPPGVKKQLALYMSHILNDETLWRYRKLRDEAAPCGVDVVWCYNTKGPDPKFPEDVKTMLASDEEILGSIKTNPRAAIGSDVLTYNTPQHWMRKALSAVKEGGYSHLWVIEYDVCCAGDWGDFFRRMNNVQCEFVCEKINSRMNSRGWCWWNSCGLDVWRERSHFMALNCISRMSAGLCERLSEFYDDNAHKGHLYYEAMWATVAMNTGSCIDIYSSDCADEFGFKKIDMSRVGEVKKGKLYHAVKADVKWADYVK